MKTAPIVCNGDDLANVLADIRARGGCVTDLTTGVGGNAGYKVNYFERGDTPDDGSSSKDKQQASENHTGKVATVRGLLLQDEGRARNAMTRKASGVCAEPSALDNVAGRTSLISEVTGKSEPERQMEETPPETVNPSIATPLPHCPTCSGLVTQGMPCPICAGLERIREGARKLRSRFRPSTREARIPHND